jgi:hypothetical protein
MSYSSFYSKQNHLLTTEFALLTYYKIFTTILQHNIAYSINNRIRLIALVTCCSADGF